MKRFFNPGLMHILSSASLILALAACVDHNPKIEDLPGKELAFTYSVADNNYQLDYYVGATIEFVSSATIPGERSWNFGDGNTATGEIVRHKYSQAGTYQVSLIIGKRIFKQNIFISDIKPLMESFLISGDICEVQNSYVGFKVELPNPENLEEEYTWTFPEGSLDENGNPISTSTSKDPGRVKFSHVGSQSVKLQVKLGGRLLEESSKNIQVAYNKEVPTLYFAVKSGNIMALKLVNDAPAGMHVGPFNMEVKSGDRPLNILFKDTALYVLDCGRQFTYVNDADKNLGDGRIWVMTKDASRIENILINTGFAFDDPFYGYIEGSTLYFTDRNTGIARVKLTDRNQSLNRTSYPFIVENNRLGYYGKGLSYGATNACFGKIKNVWYWCKTYNGNGIFRFTDSDILSEAAKDKDPAPSAGIALESFSPKSFVYDQQRDAFYFSIYYPGLEGVYKCKLEELNTIKKREDLNAYKLKLKNGKTVTPITESGKGEGSPGEFIGICQLTLDESDGSVYFGLRSGDPDVKSGLMRYNPASGHIEHLIEGIEVYGVAVNNTKSKLF